MPDDVKGQANVVAGQANVVAGVNKDANASNKDANASNKDEGKAIDEAAIAKIRSDMKAEIEAEVRATVIAQQKAKPKEEKADGLDKYSNDDLIGYLHDPKYVQFHASIDKELRERDRKFIVDEIKNSQAKQYDFIGASVLHKDFAVANSPLSKKFTELFTPELQAMSGGARLAALAAIGEDTVATNKAKAELEAKQTVGAGGAGHKTKEVDYDKMSLEEFNKEVRRNRMKAV